MSNCLGETVPPGVNVLYNIHEALCYKALLHAALQTAGFDHTTTEKIFKRNELELIAKATEIIIVI